MKHSSTISLAQVALMAACILVLGFIPPIPTGILPVPIVVQNLGIMLGELILVTTGPVIVIALYLMDVLLEFGLILANQFKVLHLTVKWLVT